MHDILCKKNCFCGKECYGHPDYNDNEHLCDKHGTEIVDEGTFKNLVWTLIEFPATIIVYICKKLKGEFNR